MAQSQTVMPMILDYRECSKIKSSFCDPLACNFRKLVFGKADASRGRISRELWQPAQVVRFGFLGFA
jgi:hypothetical protein